MQGRLEGSNDKICLFWWLLRREKRDTEDPERYDRNANERDRGIYG